MTTTGSWTRSSIGAATLSQIPKSAFRSQLAGDSIAVDNVQLEQGKGAHAFVTSPIITGAATVTRSQDVLSLPLTFNVASGTFVTQYQAPSVGGANIPYSGFAYSPFLHGFGVNNGTYQIAGSTGFQF